MRKRICFTLFSLVAVAFLPATGTIAEESDKQKPAEKEVQIASLVVKGGLPESTGRFGFFGDVRMDLRKLISRLDKAASDARLVGVVLRIRNPVIGRGRLAELRAAVRRVRKAGKKVYADLQLATPVDYLLACACDEVSMAESGTLMITGVRAEITFMKRMFDKVGIQGDMLQVGDFKGSAEPFMRDSMSPELRRQYESLVDDFYEQMIDTIADDRQLAREKVRELIDTGVFTASAARSAGLVDHVEYENQLLERIKSDVKADRVVLLENYGRKKVDADISGIMGMMKMFEMMMGGGATKRTGRTKQIALIFASGPILSGDEKVNLFGDQTIGSRTVVETLRNAEKDKSVVAIVLRVDSPGGSAAASDLIWHEIKRVGKPIVASMGDTAASGGYYIAMGCDKVFAEPGTLTGSIGVVGGKLAVGQLLDKVGVSTEIVSRGKNSGIFSTESKFSDSERQVWMQSMQETYRQFVAKAAESRSIDVDRMQTLAGGRLWTGRQAQANGLVDQLGTLQDAVEAARQLAGVNEEEKTELLILPKPKSFFDQMLDDSMIQLNLRTAVDAAVPLRGLKVAEIFMLQHMFAEPSVLVSPYRIDIR